MKTNPLIIPLQESPFIMIDWEQEIFVEKVLIGKGGYASVYKITVESEGRERKS